MGDKTGIHWTDASWNPVTGCTKVSQGCKNCYAETVAQRYWARQYSPRADGSPRRFTDVQIHADRLERPLRWTRPRRIFVNSMSDLFHPAVPTNFIAQVFGAMLLAPQHTFQVLTKRPDRMRAWVNGDEPFTGDLEGATIGDAVWFAAKELWGSGARRPAATFRALEDNAERAQWPLPNVWLGTSVDRQEEADERIPHLLQTPAAVRFLSCEPLLGPIDLTPKADDIYRELSRWYGPNGFDPERSQPERDRRQGYLPRVDWVIVGGESGAGHRPMELQWARALRDQCIAGGVPFFFKQSGGSRPGLGRELDGRLWEEFPAVDEREAVPA